MSLAQAHRVTGVAIDQANREKDDFYPTPPEGTHGLLMKEQFTGPIWEPACGDGAMARVLEKWGYEVIATDLVDRGYGTPRVEFLMETKPLAPNIVTNPPFKMVTPFIKRALELSTGKVAMLLRLACLEGIERRKIFDNSPLARVWVFSKRLSMKRGGYDGAETGGMLAFAWFVWEHGYTGKPTLGWI